MIVWLDEALSRFLSRSTKFSRYLPDLEWGELEKNHRMPSLGRHLVSSSNSTVANDSSISIVESKELDKTANIREIVGKILDISATDIVDNVPLTSYGLDSLSASRLSFLLGPFGQVSQLQLLGGSSLQEVVNLINGTNAADYEGLASAQLTTETEISKGAALIEWLHILQDTLSSAKVNNLASTHPGLDVVVVTGTTGVLGTYILRDLLINTQVQKVYAFNRPSRDGKALLVRQKQAFAHCGLDAFLLVSSPKLVLVSGDLTAPDMGIPAALKSKVRAVGMMGRARAHFLSRKILSETTHIIHNGLYLI